MSRQTVDQPAAGWYPVASQPGTWAWWDGTHWTTFTHQVDDRWEYASVGWTTPPDMRRVIEREPPSRAWVIAWFVAAGMLFVSMIMFANWGYEQLERNCRQTNPQGVTSCVSDASFGLDFIDGMLLVGAAVCVALAIVGIKRRRRAKRATP